MIFFSCKNIFLLSAFCFLVLNSANAQQADEYYKKSIEFQEKGDSKGALTFIDKALRLDSTHADYYLQRATIHYYSANYDNAIKDCYSALKIQPDKPEVYFLRGQICRVTESHGGAILFFGKTLKFTADTELKFNAYIERSMAYYELSKYTEAKEDALMAQSMQESSSKVLLPLAKIYYKLQQKEESIKLLDQLMIDDPTNVGAYELSAQIAIEAKDYKKATPYLSTYCELVPRDAKGLNKLAECYVELKDYSNALVTINKALGIDPQNPYTFKLRGIAYYENGQKEEGCNNLFKALQLGYIDQYGYDLVEIYQKRCEVVQ